MPTRATRSLRAYGGSLRRRAYLTCPSCAPLYRYYLQHLVAAGARAGARAWRTRKRAPRIMGAQYVCALNACMRAATKQRCARIISSK